MTKINHESAEKKRIESLMETLRDRLNLGWLTMHVKYDTTMPDADNDRVVCKSIPDFEYLQVTLIWNLALSMTRNPDDLRHDAIHELAHCLLAPLWSSIPDKLESSLAKMNELAAENVARAIAAALESNHTGGK